MGYIKHNAIIITADDYPTGLKQFGKVHSKAKQIFGETVSEAIRSPLNGYISFFVAPDGSKEGWDESDSGDKKRKKFADYIDKLAYEDGSNAVHFVDVSYDENHEVDIDRTNAPKLDD